LTPSLASQIKGILFGLFPVIFTFPKPKLVFYFITSAVLVYTLLMPPMNDIINLLKVIILSLLMTGSIIVYKRRLFYRTMRRLISTYVPVVESIPFSPYQEQWKNQFDEEKKRIEEALGKKFPYRGTGLIMVGSTSVKGICIAKGCHDMVLGLKSNTLPDAFVTEMEKLGYEYLGGSPHVPDGGDNWFFCVYSPEVAKEKGFYGFTLHVCLEYAFKDMDNFVAFSMYCNTFPEERKVYEETKLKWKDSGHFRYKMNKAITAQMLIKKALVWAEKEDMYKKYGYY